MVINRAISRVFAVAFGMTLAVTATVRADDSANPKYAAWSKFKPGSYNTVASDMDAHGSKIHIEVKRTLVSVSDDEVVVETKTTVNVLGHDHEYPGVNQTIKAKIDKEEIKQTGEQDVQAMGKSFKCKVFEASGKTDAPAPDKHEVPGSNIEGRKATVYANDDVPGGIVKLETVGADGKTAISFVLTDMQVK